MNRSFFHKSLVAAGLFLLTLSGSAQSLKEFFSTSEASCLYIGIDFTKNKFIDYSTINVLDVRDKVYTGANELIVNEPKKFELAKAFHKSRVDHDLSLVNEKNSKTNTETMLSSNTADLHRFKESDISDVVKTYDFSGKSGIGVLIVAEAFSKAEKTLSTWVAFVDLSSKKVLLTERVEGKVARSFGLRNEMASAIKNILEQIEKTKYAQWKTKAGA